MVGSQEVWLGKKTKLVPHEINWDSLVFIWNKPNVQLIRAAIEHFRHQNARSTCMLVPWNVMGSFYL